MESNTVTVALVQLPCAAGSEAGGTVRTGSTRQAALQGDQRSPLGVVAALPTSGNGTAHPLLVLHRQGTRFHRWLRKNIEVQDFEEVFQGQLQVHCSGTL